MDDSGHARIVDFGLAMVTKNSDSIISATLSGGHTPRWTAPEVLKDGNHSKEADIFSFAMVMIEVRHEWFLCINPSTNCRFPLIQVFTGAVPFNGRTSTTAMYDIMNGVRPPRPMHPTFTADLWELMQNCWNQDPFLRPEVSEVLSVLRGV